MGRLAGLALTLGCLAWAAALAWIVAGALPAGVDLPAAVDAELGRSGVGNPVTAVLLNFRAYDTLLEVAVLVLAVVAVWAAARGPAAATAFREAPAEPVLAALVRLIVPVAVLAAVYLTWLGSHAPGGAFQAGALLAGAAVLLLLAAIPRPPAAAAAWMRLAVAAGLAVFILVGVAGLPVTGRLLEYPPGAAYGAILLVEAALAASIGAILAEIFIDVPAAGEVGP